ncbi:hypothetical protein PWT90_05976 [Aphanocladium album]|nr:hypothetical protein PWT90_05976 [Aphanocladium album]
MKYAAILSIGLAAIASASIDVADVKRDAAPYKKVIDSISSAVDDLDDAVKKYSGGDKKPVLDASNALVTSLDNGKQTIDGLDDLQASDAVPLSGSLRDLNNKGQTLTNDLKDKRGDVEKAGECDSVRDAIGDINTSAQALVKSAISKVPKGLQSIAETFVGDFTKSFNETQDYFSTSNCKNGNGGGGGSSSAGSSVSSASSTGSGGSASSTGSAASGSSTTAPSKTSTQTATSPSGSSGASAFSPAWTLGTVMALFAVYY